MMAEANEMEATVANTKSDIGDERAISKKLQGVLAEAAMALKKTLQVNHLVI